MPEQIILAELTTTFQGEGLYRGLPIFLIRLAGCNLHCPWCDTDYSPRLVLTPDEIVEQCHQSDCPAILVTGGEPILQDLAWLERVDKFVMLETNGSLKIPKGLHVDWLNVSPKLYRPWDNEYAAIERANQINFVITSGNDLERLESELRKMPALAGKIVYLTPEWSRQNEILKEIVTWKNRPPLWRLGIQAHKIWRLP
ncbi:MAG: 7-carboxy-7-deazaguanine synthase QueE [Candidatus Kryptoniota bacterium]